MSIGELGGILRQASQELTDSQTGYRGAEMDFEAAGEQLGIAEDSINDLGDIRNRIGDLTRQMTNLTGDYDRILGAIALHTSNAEEAAKRGLADSQNVGKITDAASLTIIDATVGSSNPTVTALHDQAKAMYVNGVGPNNAHAVLAVTETTEALQKLGDPSALTEYLQETAQRLTHHAEMLEHYIGSMHSDNAGAQAAATTAQEVHVEAGIASLELAETAHRAAEAL